MWPVDQSLDILLLLAVVVLSNALISIPMSSSGNVSYSLHFVMKMACIPVHNQILITMYIVLPCIAVYYRVLLCIAMYVCPYLKAEVVEEIMGWLG